VTVVSNGCFYQMGMNIGPPTLKKRQFH